MPALPTKTRTRLAPQARRRQIVDVARGLFATHPYAEVTVAAIAREAGVTRALVHHYFGSVGEIYLAVLGELAAEGVEIPGNVEGLRRQERVARNVDNTASECSELEARIRGLDAAARQPLPGFEQDRIRNEKKQARDRQFALRCR